MSNAQYCDFIDTLLSQYFYKQVLSEIIDKTIFSVYNNNIMQCANKLNTGDNYGQNYKTDCG